MRDAGLRQLWTISYSISHLGGSVHVAHRVGRSGVVLNLET
jgi:hypothetical protein